NQYCAHLYGRGPDELLGGQSAQYSIEPVTPELRSEIGEQILAGKGWEGDFAVPRADETVVEVHAMNSPVFDESGEVTGVISLAFDVTSERATQEQLRQMVAMAQILRDVGQTLVEELDADRVMQTVTDAARRLTGATVGAFVRTEENARDFAVAALSGRAAVPAGEIATPT